MTRPLLERPLLERPLLESPFMARPLLDRPLPDSPLLLRPLADVSGSSSLTTPPSTRSVHAPTPRASVAVSSARVARRMAVTFQANNVRELTIPIGIVIRWLPATRGASRRHVSNSVLSPGLLGRGAS